MKQQRLGPMLFIVHMLDPMLFIEVRSKVVFIFKAFVTLCAREVAVKKLLKVDVIFVSAALTMLFKRRT